MTFYTFFLKMLKKKKNLEFLGQNDIPCPKIDVPPALDSKIILLERGKQKCVPKHFNGNI